jgi:hypothetical protein
MLKTLLRHLLSCIKNKNIKKFNMTIPESHPVLLVYTIVSYETNT